MKKTFEYEIVQVSDLNQEQLQLVSAAKEAVSKAYAPYSKFKVGAAIQLENGKIIVGNNQENAAYPSGLCAERVAIYAAKSQYPEQKIKRIALHTNRKDASATVAPCGSCRQSILEYEVEQRDSIEIIFQGERDSYIIVQGIKELLPFYFDNTRL